jgi:hypothetical protein
MPRRLLTAGSFEQLCRVLKSAYQKTELFIIRGNHFVDKIVATSAQVIHIQSGSEISLHFHFAPVSVLVLVAHSSFDNRCFRLVPYFRRLIHLVGIASFKSSKAPCKRGLQNWVSEVTRDPIDGKRTRECWLLGTRRLVDSAEHIWPRLLRPLVTHHSRIQSSKPCLDRTR